MLAIVFDLKRSGDGRNCKLELKYKELSQQGFPVNVISDLVLQAEQKVDKDLKRQPKISNFFQVQKNVPVSSENLPLHNVLDCENNEASVNSQDLEDEHNIIERKDFENVLDE